MSPVDIFGVGAPRSGTTWLYRCLSEHPATCVSSPKELHFFSEWMAFTPTHSDMSLDWYRSKFTPEDPSQRLVDVSPSYLYDARACANIHAYNPEAKIIVQLRDPVKAAYSFFLHGRCTFMVNDDFESYLQSNPRFLSIFRYDTQVSRYLNAFGRKNLLFVGFDDMVRDPVECFDRICGFLGVESMTPSMVHDKVNALGHYKFRFLRNCLSITKSMLDDHPVAAKAYKAWGMDDIALRLVKWNREPGKGNAPAMSDDTIEMLSSYYRESNRVTQEITGIRTDQWT